MIQLTRTRLIFRASRWRVRSVRRASLHDRIVAAHAFSVSAKGTRDLVADGRFYGLASVVKGTPVIVSQQLTAGTYYLFDVNPVSAGQAPKLTTLQVGGPGGDQIDSHFPIPGHLPVLPGHLRSVPIHLPSVPIHLPSIVGHLPVLPGRATVELTSADTFVSPNVLPRAGTLTVRNVSDTIHFMEVSPVKPGTTDAQIQDFFDHASGPQDQPSFSLDGPSIEMGVQSPGRQADITYSLPAGTYVLLCFAEDEDGTPHAIMGMHKVVTLK